MIQTLAEIDILTQKEILKILWNGINSESKLIKVMSWKFTENSVVQSRL